MNSEYSHKILVVDDEPPIGRLIKKLLAWEDLAIDFCLSGESAIQRVKQAEQPYAVIISDQYMNGMTGIEFLELTRKYMPDTIRFLLTGYLEMKTLLDSVNKCSIHKYISKPMEQDGFIAIVRSGIRAWESSLENRRLMAAAKAQNAKLYELDCELMAAAKRDGRVIEKLDREIEALKAGINTPVFRPQTLPGDSPLPFEDLLPVIKHYTGSDPEIAGKKLDHLFSGAVRLLHTRVRQMGGGA